MKSTTLFVGTYTDTSSEGIYSYQFDLNTGALSSRRMVAALTSPSFVKISPDKNYLYAVQESDTYDSLSGGVSAFRIKEKGLDLINTKASRGAHPCHIGISSDGRTLAVSNYSGGNFTVFSIAANGSLVDSGQLISHKKLDTTKTSHVHSAVFNDSLLFIADLGLDQIRMYKNDNNSYISFEKGSIDLNSGDGPRHFTFSRKGDFLYVINEHSSTISVFHKDESGIFVKTASKSTLRPNFKGESFCADVHLSSDGKFLYGSNRGENTIVVFEVNQNTGGIKYLQSTDVKGDWPRNFSIDPSGKFVLVANQKSNNITVFSRNIETGFLKFMHEVQLPRPVCLEFL